MTWILMAELLMGAVAYAVFHYFFFQYMITLLDRSMSWRTLMITYLINYSFFLLLTRLAWHLLVNWSLICLLFFLEVSILYRRNTVISALIALEGALVGLSTNIFTRCVAAIILNRPLVHFDNNVYLDSNIKIYPVSIAFLLGGIIFYGIPKTRQFSLQKNMLKDNFGVVSLLVFRGVLYLFLLLNLFAYYITGNSLSMKLWGIKSAVFVVTVSYVANRYISQVSSTRLFRQEIREGRRELLRQKQQEEKLRMVAFTDTLTGCYNRAYLGEVFAELEETDAEVTICFLDLDNLKKINDTYGHFEGDHYLITVVNIFKEFVDADNSWLIRYGGDEFLIVYKNQPEQQIRENMRSLQNRVHNHGYMEGHPYPMSVSYGIAYRKEGKNLQSVLQLADTRMYEEKNTPRRIAGHEQSSDL